MSTPPKVLALCQWACNALIGTPVLDFRPLHKKTGLNFVNLLQRFFHIPVVNMKYVMQVGASVRITPAVTRDTPLEKILSAAQALDQFHDCQPHAAQKQHDAQQGQIVQAAAIALEIL